MLQHLQTLFQSLDFASMGGLLLRLVSVFLCLTVHEICHGLAALALGDPTARSMHRLSLNPLRHIDWLGLAMMVICGFGWAKPVPVDPRYFKKPKKGMALTALAGPVSNLMLAALLMAGASAVYYHAAYTPTMWEGVFSFLLDTAILSIGLGLFNLIPVPPLDGAKVLGALLPDRTYFTLMRYERYGMLVLLLLSFTNIGGGLLSRGIAAVYNGLANLIF